MERESLVWSEAEKSNPLVARNGQPAFPSHFAIQKTSRDVQDISVHLAQPIPLEG